MRPHLSPLPFRHSLRLLLACIATSGLPVAVGAQDDWYVDGSAPDCMRGTGGRADPFCDIGTALAVAEDGDSIHIAPGTYPENLRISKDVDLIGSGGPAATVLDGMASGSVVEVLGATVRLRGLTFTNGTGTDTGAGIRGGGIYYSSPGAGTFLHLYDCVIRGNSSEHGGGVFGAGMVVLEDSRISNNSATNSGGGGAVSTLLALSSEIADNIGMQGGGLRIDGGTIADCHISGNTAFTGGGLYVASEAGPVEIVRCTLVENQADGGGAGLFAVGAFEPLSIHLRETSILGNTGGGNPAGLDHLDPRAIVVLGTLLSDVGEPFVFHMQNCLVAGNTAGLHLGCQCTDINAHGVASIVNSTITENPLGAIRVAAVDRGEDSVHCTLSNSIVWDNGSMPLGTSVSGAFLDVRYSITPSGWGGPGTLHVDPEFANPSVGDYRLAPGSPCIDAGDNTALPSRVLVDLQGLPRLGDDPATPDTGIGGPPTLDMGAYEFHRRTGLPRGSPRAGPTISVPRR